MASHANGCSRCINCGIAAADHRHPLAQRNSFSPGYLLQNGHGAHDLTAGDVCRQFHLNASMRSCGQKHIVEGSGKSFQWDIFADFRIWPQLNAHK